jgi:hypothetical protein
MPRHISKTYLHECLHRTLFVRFKAYTVYFDGVHLDKTLKTEILNEVHSVYWAVQTSEGVIYALLDCGHKKLYVRLYLGGVSPASMKLYQADSYTKLLEWAASKKAYRLYSAIV